MTKLKKNTKLSYEELKKLNTYEERFDYLKQNGVIGQTTFGFDRYINQALYASPEWKKVRREIILRDEGCDLGVDGFPLDKKGIIVHHINPITEQDIENRSRKVFDHDNLICCSLMTHNAIHYGNDNPITFLREVERRPNDTSPWK